MSYLQKIRTNVKYTVGHYESFVLLIGILTDDMSQDSFLLPIIF